MVSTVDNLATTKFNRVFKEDYQRTRSWLSMCVNNDGVTGDETCRWEVMGLADAARKRNADGSIPSSDPRYSTVSAALEEHVIKHPINDFAKFTANPNIMASKSKQAATSLWQAMDQKIVDTLDTNTNLYNNGTPITANNLGRIQAAVNELFNNDVENDGKIWGLITPNFYRQMEKLDRFANIDYTNIKAADGSTISKGYRSWMDVNWITYTGLTGRGTASAKCHLFHQDAIGHQSNTPRVKIWEDHENLRSGVSGDLYHAGAILLPRGIITVNHNDAATLVDS